MLKRITRFRYKEQLVRSIDKMLLAAAIIIPLLITCVAGGGMSDFVDPHSKSTGTQNDNKWDVSNSGIPHLPMMTGFMGTHGTYRQMSVMEQMNLLVGEPKHGLWRYQEKGLIREYRKKGRPGLPPGTDPNSATLSENHKGIIRTNYAHYIPEESWEGYKYYDDLVSKGDGTYDTVKGALNFIDISIYHDKYAGKYNTHVAIDLPNWYCTMTQPEYPHIYNAWKYSIAQPLANKIGPLGLRAGLDLKENYPNVIRYNFVDNAGLWAQVGNGEPANDVMIKNITEQPDFVQNVNYQRVNRDQTDIEVYMVERPFFNKPYLFVTAIFNNKNGPSELAYIRPGGAYWDGLVAMNKVAGFPAAMRQARHYPKVHVSNYPTAGSSSIQTVYGLPLYGTHHLNRTAQHMTGGACPNRGGDWGYYPWGESGSSWPSTYQEITPICDAIVIDMKLSANLWVDTWEDPALGLANSALKTHVVDYDVDVNLYGGYTDPYLVQSNAINPEFMDLTPDQKLVGPADPKRPRRVLKMKYKYMGKLMDFNKVDGLRPPKKCPKPVTCPEEKKCPTQKTVTQPRAEPEPENKPGWGSDVHTLVAVVLALVILVVIIIFVVCVRIMRTTSDDDSPTVANGKQNPAFSSA